MSRILCDTKKKEKRLYLKPTNGKSKDNPSLVAKAVIKQIKKKQLINVSRAMKEVGYSSSTISKKVGEIQKKPAYKLVMDNFLESLKEKRAMTLALTTEKDIAKATLRDKVYAFDIYNKNTNLLEGKPTSLDAGIGAFLLRISQAGNDNTSNTDVNNTLHSKDNNKDNT